jgi:amidohydrolase
MPNNGIDPITVAAHVITALQEINARELGMADEAVVTIGTINSGNAANVIPDTASLSGTIRTYDEETRAYIKKRVSEISSSIGTAFRADVKVTYGSGCPCLTNDSDLAKCSSIYLKELLGASKTFTAGQLSAMSGDNKASKSTGSEDFAYVSQEVPSIMFALAAGTPKDGYCYPQHHPKVKFDEAVLSEGSAVYSYMAMRWLEEHSGN